MQQIQAARQAVQELVSSVEIPSDLEERIRAIHVKHGVVVDEDVVAIMNAVRRLSKQEVLSLRRRLECEERKPVAVETAETSPFDDTHSLVLGHPNKICSQLSLSSLDGVITFEADLKETESLIDLLRMLDLIVKPEKRICLSFADQSAPNSIANIFKILLSANEWGICNIVNIDIETMDFVSGTGSKTLFILKRRTEFGESDSTIYHAEPISFQDFMTNIHTYCGIETGSVILDPFAIPEFMNAVQTLGIKCLGITEREQRLRDFYGEREENNDNSSDEKSSDEKSEERNAGESDVLDENPFAEEPASQEEAMETEQITTKEQNEEVESKVEETMEQAQETSHEEGEVVSDGENKRKRDDEEEEKESDKKQKTDEEETTSTEAMEVECKPEHPDQIESKVEESNNNAEEQTSKVEQVQETSEEQNSEEEIQPQQEIAEEVSETASVASEEQISEEEIQPQQEIAEETEVAEEQSSNEQEVSETASAVSDEQISEETEQAQEEEEGEQVAEEQVSDEQQPSEQ